MEITLYILFSLFVWLSFFISYFAPKDGDRVFMKLFSFILFQGLGIFSLVVTFLTNHPLLADRTLNSLSYQQALLVVYSLIGFFQLFVGIWDYLNIKGDSKNERRF